MRPLMIPCALFAAAFRAEATLAAPLAPKVLVITMFAAESAPWTEGRNLDTRIAVPGLSKEFPDVACDAAGLCVMTDPSDATLGSALWARYVVDGGLRHEIDPRQVPAGWPNGVLGLGATAPDEKPTWGAGTEVYHLSDPLVDRALALTRDVELVDSPEAASYRATYVTEAARAAPVTRICDTASMDTYWHGSLTPRASSNGRRPSPMGRPTTAPPRWRTMPL